LAVDRGDWLRVRRDYQAGEGSVSPCKRHQVAAAETILSLAERHQYTTNLQARGLGGSRSSLVGLMLPIHDNRYFSATAQTGQCPVVVSASRDQERNGGRGDVFPMTAASPADQGPPASLNQRNMIMIWTETIGFLGSFSTVLTYSMKAMLWLHISAELFVLLPMAPSLAAYP
jgi:hypothetical protein